MVVCHASIVPVPICFAGIHVHLVVYLVAGCLSIPPAGVHTYLCWFWCRYALLQLLFLIGDILRWSPLGCHWFWVVCILVAAVASSGRSWICPSSWISPPVLILCCWTRFWRLTSWMLELLLRLGSLFNRPRLWIGYDSSPTFPDVQCRKIARTWHLWIALLVSCV